MAKLLRALTALLVTTTLLVGGAAQPAHGQQDTAAVAVNTRDGASIFRFAFSIRQVMGSTVDVDNAAVAWSSCADCRTVAVSFQIVIAQGDVESLETDNLALAVNYECSSCESFAAAYQFVVGGTTMRLTPEGQQQLALIHRRLADLSLRQEEMTLEELDAELDAIAADIASVLETELEVVTRPEGESGSTTTSTTSTTASSDGTGSTTSTAPAVTSTTATTENADTTSTTAG